MLRYVIAFLAAVVIVGGGALFCWQTKRALIRQFQEAVRDPANADSLTPEIQAAADEGRLPEDFGFEVSQSMLLRISLSDWLVGYWPLWVLLTFGGSFGIAYFLHNQP